MVKLLRLQMIALIISVAIFATYGFAASDTKNSPHKGEGAAPISGWNISNVHYRLGKNGSNLGGVEFDLDGPASQVMVGFENASERTFSCYHVDGFHWSCEVDGIEVSRMDTLRVTAVN
jgi:hypothetical protein